MEENCASSWLFTKIFNEMHGQQNMKFYNAKQVILCSRVENWAQRFNCLYFGKPRDALSFLLNERRCGDCIRHTILLLLW